MVNALKSRSGGSLAELLVTILIIGIATLIIMAFSRNNLLMSRDSRGSEAAALAAEDKLTELSTLTNPGNGSDNDTIDNVICSRIWTIKDTAYIKRAIVKITFKSLKGTTREKTFSGAIN